MFLVFLQRSKRQCWKENVWYSVWPEVSLPIKSPIWQVRSSSSMRMCMWSWQKMQPILSILSRSRHWQVTSAWSIRLTGISSSMSSMCHWQSVRIFLWWHRLLPMWSARWQTESRMICWQRRFLQQNARSMSPLRWTQICLKIQSYRITSKSLRTTGFIWLIRQTDILPVAIPEPERCQSRKHCFHILWKNLPVKKTWLERK